MTSSREKVLELLATQRITPAEADTLLKAMGTGKRTWSSLLDPLQLMTPWVGISLTAVPIALALVLERHGVRSDGALDIHVGEGPSSLPRALLDAALGFPFLAAVLWLGTVVAGRRARFVDVLATVGVARWPLALAAVTLLPLAGHPLLTPTNIRPADLVLLVPMLPLVVLAIAMLCLGVCTASGLRGGRLALTMVVSLAVATGLSKLLLAVL